MPIKTILVPMIDAQGAQAALGAALGLAKSLKAHVDVLHLRAEPTEAITDFVGETVSPSLIEEVMEAAEKSAAKTSSKARDAFDAATKRAKVPVTNRVSAQTAATASYSEESGQADLRVERSARIHDLVILRRPRSDTDVGVRALIETALMSTGRPVLLVPAIGSVKVGSNIAIAWNGSAESSRAVAAALPFLTRAKSVTVLSITDGDDVNHDGLGAYLKRHGVRAKFVTGRNRGGDIGKAVTAAASRAGADMLVMGAYTHSRVREMIWGGVTNHVLANTRIPVFLAH